MRGGIVYLLPLLLGVPRQTDEMLLSRCDVALKPLSECSFTECKLRFFDRFRLTSHSSERIATACQRLRQHPLNLIQFALA
jgi:hypothetical protein